jgi:hypothetical protein
MLFANNIMPWRSTKRYNFKFPKAFRNHEAYLKRGEFGDRLEVKR